jgi:hypothetical protein
MNIFDFCADGVLSRAADVLFRHHETLAEGDLQLDRDSALQAARKQFEIPIWALLGQL